MSAASNVFAIPELLEHILSELPPLDIIRYKRVCKSWKQLISDSPLLQYRTWMRNDYVETVAPDDLIPELHWQMPEYKEIKADKSKEADYHRRRYIYNVSRHLNPIVVSRIMKNMPQDPRFSFDPEPRNEGESYGGYFNLRPVLLRDLVQWYEKNKDTEDNWGHMPLYRPESQKIRWSVPCSDDAGIPFELQAKAGSLGLTMKDLMDNVGSLWWRWKESEVQIHYLSHDAGYCDFDQGFPERCLDSDDEEEEEVDEDDEDYCGKEEKLGVKRTVEEHLEQCVKKASD